MMIDRLRQWAKAIKRDVLVLWLAASDPRVPWYAKVIAGAVAAYALSPVDLIPDFIPVLGYVDDLLIVPAGILLAIKLMPPNLVDELRERATEIERRPKSRGGMIAIVLIWIAAAGLCLWLAWPFIGGS